MPIAAPGVAARRLLSPGFVFSAFTRATSLGSFFIQGKQRVKPMPLGRPKLENIRVILGALGSLAEQLKPTELSQALNFASSEKSVGHQYDPTGVGSSARAVREPDVG
jgi:hypothetical protein